jgi:hypothetical protein
MRPADGALHKESARPIADAPPAPSQRSLPRVRSKPLSGLDAGFLDLEAAGTPMPVGSLMRVEPPKRRGDALHTAVTTRIAEGLPKARALRRQLVDAPLELAHPMWGEAAGVDWSHHITRETLPRPARSRRGSRH